MRYAATTDVVVTRHGDRRARARLGLKRKAVLGVADRALTDGRRAEEYSGDFRRYLDQLASEDRNADNVRVYAGSVFLFAGAALLTVWPLTGQLRKAAGA
jgi:hypothetical protein